MFWYWLVWQEQAGEWSQLNVETIDLLLQSRMYMCPDLELLIESGGERW